MSEAPVVHEFQIRESDPWYGEFVTTEENSWFIHAHEFKTYREWAEARFAAMAEAVASARAEAIEEFGAPTEDELDERIARQGARENMRLIDSISDLIGQPHDVELTKSDVANALASARAEGVKEGLERAADEVEGIASEWRGDGRAYAMTVAAILRTGDALSSAMSALPAPPTLIPGGSSDV